MGHPADRRAAAQLVLLFTATVAAAGSPAQAVLAGLPVATLDGRQVQLDQYASQVTLVALWAHWCKPCIAELPMLDALHRRHQGDGAVAVVAVNVDLPEAQERARAIAAGLHLSMPVVIDTSGQVRRRVNGLLGHAESAPLSLPQTLLLDLEGRPSGERGFPIGISEGEFVAAKERLIERALRGGAPPPPAVDRLRLTPFQGKVLVSSPRLSSEQIAQQLPAVRELLVRTFSTVSSEGIEAMLKTVAETMRSGGSVEVAPPG